MDESKHTLGPWKLNPQPNPNRPTYYSVYVKPGGPETVDHICMVSHQMSENWQANARLIAAAPKLLEACKAVRFDILDRPTPHVRIETLKKVQTAIAEAEKNKRR